MGINMRELAAAVSMCTLAAACMAAWAEGNAEAGRQKSAACAACHGIDGNSTNPQWPKLAGQHALYLETAIRAYRAGIRENPLMQPMAEGLSDEDIRDLAAYYSSQQQE
jgi:cytochrome c553